MNDRSEPAALWRRLAAVLYDSLLVTALLLVLTAAVVIGRGGAPFDPESPAFRALLLFTMWLYFGWCWTHGGQTVGMRAWRLRLEDRRGGPVSWTQSLVQFAGAWLSALPLGLGYWWSLLDGERRCWHDRLAGTRLRYLRRQPQTDAPSAARPSSRASARAKAQRR